MNEETRRGYDLPLTENKLLAWVMLVLAGFASGYLWGDMAESGYDLVICLASGVGILLMFYIALLELGRSFAKLHLVPEGIAVTLFGKTLRRFPRERIRFLGGVTYRKKSTIYKWICVCARSLEELAEEQERKTPKMLRNARTRPGWAEDMAGSYLWRCANSLRAQAGFPRKDILLIEWSPERLELLLEMYPGVPWVDLTEKKKLDAERG